MNFKFSGVAQLVEQATVNRWVTGSSPVAGATFQLFITAHTLDNKQIY